MVIKALRGPESVIRSAGGCRYLISTARATQPQVGRVLLALDGGGDGEERLPIRCWRWTRWAYPPMVADKSAEKLSSVAITHGKGVTAHHPAAATCDAHSAATVRLYCRR